MSHNVEFLPVLPIFPSIGILSEEPAKIPSWKIIAMIYLPKEWMDEWQAEIESDEAEGSCE